MAWRQSIVRGGQGFFNFRIWDQLEGVIERRISLNVGVSPELSYVFDTRPSRSRSQKTQLQAFDVSWKFLASYFVFICGILGSAKKNGRSNEATRRNWIFTPGRFSEWCGTSRVIWIDAVWLLMNEKADQESIQRRSGVMGLAKTVTVCQMPKKSG